MGMVQRRGAHGVGSSAALLDPVPRRASRRWLVALITLLTIIAVPSAATAASRVAQPETREVLDQASCGHIGGRDESGASTANTYTYVNGNPVNLSDPDGHGAVDAYGNQVPVCVYNPSACSPASRTQAHTFYSHRLRAEEADASATAAPAPAPPSPTPPSSCPVFAWMCDAGSWVQQNSDTLLQMTAHTGELALGTLAEVGGGGLTVACGAGEVLSVGIATEIAAPCMAGGVAVAGVGFGISMHAANSLAEDSGRLHFDDPESPAPSSESSPARGTSHEPESGSQVSKGSERGLGQSSARPTGTSSEEPAPAPSHSSGISVFRTPRSGNGLSELTNGVNPANHETDVFGQAPGHAYVGSEDVAGSFVGVQGYEDFSIEYQMAPEFEQEFAPFRREYDGDRSRFEYQIPHSSIGRFNELTVARVRSLQ